MLKSVFVGVGFGAVLFAPTQVVGMKRNMFGRVPVRLQSRYSSFTSPTAKPKSYNTFAPLPTYGRYQDRTKFSSSWSTTSSTSGLSDTRPRRPTCKSDYLPVNKSQLMWQSAHERESGWSCSACGYRNQPTNRKCAAILQRRDRLIFGTPRYPTKRSAPSPPVAILSHRKSFVSNTTFIKNRFGSPSACALKNGEDLRTSKSSRPPLFHSLVKEESEWKCPSCGYINFAKHDKCANSQKGSSIFQKGSSIFQCDTPRPNPVDKTAPSPARPVPVLSSPSIKTGEPTSAPRNPVASVGPSIDGVQTSTASSRATPASPEMSSQGSPTQDSDADSDADDVPETHLGPIRVYMPKITRTGTGNYHDPCRYVLNGQLQGETRSAACMEDKATAFLPDWCSENSEFPDGYEIKKPKIFIEQVVNDNDCVIIPCKISGDELLLHPKSVTRNVLDALKTRGNLVL